MLAKPRISKILIGSGIAIILIFIGAVIAEGAISGTYFDFGGKRVTNAGTPTAANDVGTKGYVDAAIGGVSFTYYCFIVGPDGQQHGTPVCTNAGGDQGYCPSGYKQKLALGSWGHCFYYGEENVAFVLPPGGNCNTSYPWDNIMGQAYVCSQ